LSGQSLPLPSDVEIDESRLYIEVTVHAPGIDAAKSVSSVGVKASSNSSGLSTSSDSCSIRTKAIVGNAYNPAWKESLRLSFDTYRGLLDLAFVKIEIKNAVTLGDDVTFAHYHASLGSLEQGKRIQKVTVESRLILISSPLRRIPLPSSLRQSNVTIPFLDPFCEDRSHRLMTATQFTLLMTSRLLVLEIFGIVPYREWIRSFVRR